MISVIRNITCITLCLFLHIATVMASTNQLSWVEDSFEDFVDGKFDDAGQNIYVTRDGKIRTIHRFDLNDDGYIDLLFNSASDENENVNGTLASVTADRQMHTSELAVEGSLEAAVADFNNDSWFDVVLRPNDISHHLTIIWGGPDGLPAYRSNGFLPAHATEAIATADMNSDGLEDT